ncbi:unnamed protein product [Clonostachys rhizophaga]|uniref:Amidohydrolase-related domain-containing protein n=1 Tax=Clonostachys rhizophaga TaxID=160324 RepID=A0A9N9VXR5_9HYPO|nr:unnamed protein product [Clonostachys rhizophaga]
MLVDPRAGIVHEGMSLHLAGGKVVKVTPTTSHDFNADFRYGEQQVEKIDASSYFLCPGLIDCRVHLMAVHGSVTLHGAFTFPHETAVIRTAGTLRGILSNGFTSVRDTGGATIAHAQATEGFLIPGSRVFQSGRMLSQNGGHGDDTEVWSDNHCCARHLKVCTSGGIASATDRLESLQFTAEELQAISTVNKNMGDTLVTAHCYTAEGVRHAIAGGVRGIEHGNMIDPETAQLTAEKSFSHLPWHSIQDVGVVVCYWTDTTAPTLVMQIYEFIVRSKILPSLVVLRQATVNGANQVGMEGKLGELVEGSFADLLSLDENPLEDFASLDRIKENLMLVMRDGRIVKSQIPGIRPEWN